jgi:type IV pilus assembly protein PilA
MPGSAPGVYSGMPPGNAGTSGKAIGSLVCGILFFFLPAAIVAVVLGHLSLSEIRQSAGRLAGRGMAIAGLVLGYLGLSFIPILIIAAIAIPNLLRAKMAANEASVIISLRSYNAALARYAEECPNEGYPANPAHLELDGSRPNTCSQESPAGVPQGSPLPVKWGYRYFYIPMELDASGHISKYGLAADAVTQGATGVRHFYTDETGIIRSSERGGADSKSPPVQ